MKKHNNRGNNRNKKMNEFRRYKNEPHPKYVYNRSNDKFDYLSMTHTPPKDFEKDYVGLDHSADPEDHRKSYISTKSENDNMRNFGARKKGWYFNSKDKKLVKGIIKKNKKGK